jgi:nitrate reductase NapE component
MKRRELITLLVCAVSVWPLKGLLIALALASPAFAFAFTLPVVVERQVEAA